MHVNHLSECYGSERPDIIDSIYKVVNFEDGVRVMLDLCMFAEGEEQQEAMAAVGDRAKLEVTIPSGELVFSLRGPLGQPKPVTRTYVPVDRAAGSHHGRPTSS